MEGGRGKVLLNTLGIFPIASPMLGAMCEMNMDELLDEEPFGANISKVFW